MRRIVVGLAATLAVAISGTPAVQAATPAAPGGAARSMADAAADHGGAVAGPGLSGSARLAGPAAARAVALPARQVAAPPGSRRRTVVGTVRLLAADPVEHAPTDDGGRVRQATEHYRLVLVTDTGSFFLKGRKARPGTRARISGQVTGTTMQAEAVTEIAAVPSALPASGTTRVLVLLAHWNTPDSVTPASARAQMFTDSNGYFRDASYGRLGQAGDVTPWMKIAGPAGGKCFADSANVMTQAKKAAAALGYDAGRYDNVVLYFPDNSWQAGSDCAEHAGWAYVGEPGTWLHGHLDRRVTVHEQGHNYGLAHSHSYLCSNGMTGTCDQDPYGDPYDAMGSATYVGHFSASQKHLLGWLDGRTADLTPGGSATLAPFASNAVATTAVRVAASSTRTYWLEYRRPADFDAALPEWATDGVLLHVTDPTIGPDGGPSLIDARPADGASTLNATMLSGSSWTSPEGLRFSVGAVTATGAAVSVVSGPRPVCRDQALEPDAAGTARTVAVPTTQRRAFCTSGDEDWVKFAAVAGQTYRLQTLNLATSVPVDTLLSLYAANGTTLLASNDDTVGLAAQITFKATASGSYLLKATQYNGVAGESFTYDLRVANADAVAPTVTTRAPASGATGVSRTGNVTATFSEPVTGVGASTFTLRNTATGAAVAAAVARTGSTNQWVLNPGADLAADTRYTATLTGGATGIRDPAGNPLVTTAWTFTTGPRPAVTTRAPASGATGVGRTANLTATFSEPVTGVAGTTFTVKNAATGATVTAVVTRNGTTHQWVLNPGATLAASTRYTVSLTGGPSAIRDAAGNPLASTGWSFTTGG